MKEELFNDLKKEVLEIQDRYPKISPDNAFVVWFLRAFITEDEKTLSIQLPDAPVIKMLMLFT